MNILLCCDGGFSSSLVAANVQSEAKKQDKDVKCWAVSFGGVEDYIGEIDVVLMGPQAIHAKNSVEEKCRPHGIPVGVMSHRDYGFCDGAAVLKQAEQLIAENK